MPPETQPKIREAIDALLSTAQEQQQVTTNHGRRANLIAFITFLISLSAISWLSWLCCSFFLAEKESVAGGTVLYSLFGFLISYWLALSIHHRLSQPTS